MRVIQLRCGSSAWLQYLRNNATLINFVTGLGPIAYRPSRWKNCNSIPRPSSGYQAPLQATCQYDTRAIDVQIWLIDGEFRHRFKKFGCNMKVQLHLGKIQFASCRLPPLRTSINLNHYASPRFLPLRLSKTMASLNWTQKKFKLNTGDLIPAVGLGRWNDATFLQR